MHRASAQLHRLGGDGRLVLLGDSAVGNLVASAALRLRDDGERLVDALVLLYPVLAPGRRRCHASRGRRGR